MSSAMEIRSRRRWIAMGLGAVLAGTGAAAAVMYYLFKWQAWVTAAHTLQTALLLSFVAVGWREIGFLFRQPAKNMGTGWSRVWAVARAAMAEAWAGRIWLLPVLWLGAAFIMIGSVRTLGLSERIPEYIRMLLTSQELLLLVMMWVMACVSLPREREKKIVVTNASKPLSRLEMVLGKMVGFSVMAGAMLLIMGAMSLLILYVSNERVKAAAASELELQQTDTAHLSRGTLKAISQEGSLFAYNYITVPPGGMSIIGGFQMAPDGPVRLIKGGSGEKVTYTFSPRLMADASVLTAAVGTRPVFVFNFPEISTGATEAPQLQVSAYCSSPARAEPPRPQEKTLTLNQNGIAVWEPDRPDQLYSVTDPSTGELQDLGPVTVEVQCITPGWMLQVYEGADANPATGQVPPGTQFNVWYSQDFNHAGLGGMPPQAHPLERGFERHDRQEIAGPKVNDPVAEMAVFRFPGDVLGHVPFDKDGNFTLTLLLETYAADNATVPTDINVQIYSMDKGGDQKPFEVSNLEVTEKRAMTLLVPGSELAKDPKNRGDLYVCITTPTRSHSVSLVEDSVRIELPPALFAVNLFKSEAVIFLEAVLLIVIGVTCSVRLGWAVAMFLSAVVFIFGYFVEFIVGIQEVGGLAALNYHPLGHAAAVFTFFDKATNGVWIFLGAIARMAPDFSGYQPQAFIPELRNMPWSVLGTNLLDTVVVIVPVIAIAYLLARKQELG